MGQVRLILADIDGTLVPFGEAGVRSCTLEAIHELQRAGLRFGPSSGRERCDLVDFFHGDEDSVGTGILSNGKLVYVDGQLVWYHPLPTEMLREVGEAVWHIPGAVLVFTQPVDAQGRCHRGFYGMGATEEERAGFLRSAGEPLANGLVEQPPEGVTTAAVLFDAQITTCEEVQQALCEAIPYMDFPQSAPFVIDVLERGWTKLTALPMLEERLGIGRDEMLYLGDSANDLSMMAAIPNSVCMGNGTPEVKAAARWVVRSCEDDGAARVMRSLAAHGGAIVPEEWV